jgi:RHS repeat-associated protein
MDGVNSLTRRGPGAAGTWVSWQSRGYDGLSRVEQIRYGTVGGPTVLGWGYGYDPLRPQRRVSTYALAGNLPGWAVAYNERGEVTGASRGTGALAATAVPGQNWGFAYDGIGNRLAVNRGLSGEAGTATGGVQTTLYIPNALNQYAGITRPDAYEVTGVTAAGVPTVKINGQPPSGRPPGNGEPGGFAQWLDGLAGAAGGPWAEINLVVNRNTSGSAQAASYQRGGPVFVRPSEVPVYDVDGNLTQDGWGTYEWDGENRLKSAEMHAGVPALVALQRMELVYDAQGRRVAKRLLVKEAVDATGNIIPRETTWRLVKELRFWYDGWNLIVEQQKRPNGQWRKLRTYLWGQDLSGSLQGAGGVGGLLGLTVNLGALEGETGVEHSYATLTEVNGNLMGLLDAGSGSLVARWDYDPFGNLVTDWYALGSGASGALCPIRFSSKYQDEETGWLYYGYRYYDAVNGRFIGRDPIEEAGGMNLYGFCGNDGVNDVDVLGMGKVKLAKTAYLKLRERLRKIAPGKFEVHHIIVQDVWKVPKYQKLLKGLGFEKHAASNVVALPTKAGKGELIACHSKHMNRAIHQGRTAAEPYVNQVMGELDRIDDLLSRGEIKECDAMWLVKDLQNSMRQKLIRGEIELNKAQVEALGDGAVSLGGLVTFGANATLSKEPQGRLSAESILLKFKVTHYTENESGCVRLIGQILDFVNPLSDYVDVFDDPTIKPILTLPPQLFGY